MKLSITESDGTKRTMQGAIKAIHIDVEEATVSVTVTGIMHTFVFKIKDAVITEERTLF